MHPRGTLTLGSSPFIRRQVASDATLVAVQLAGTTLRAKCVNWCTVTVPGARDWTQTHDLGVAVMHVLLAPVDGEWCCMPPPPCTHIPERH